MKGVVKWFNGKKGYGMIRGDDDNNYFFHYTDITSGAIISDNNRVVFDSRTVKKRLTAKRVIPL